MSEITIRAHMETHEGKVREQNEDCCDLDEELRYFAVFDGMGGHNAGDVASQTARDVVREYLRNNLGKEPETLIRGALDSASKSIYLEAKRKRELHGMGTTAVVCMLSESPMGDLVAVVGHAGDSRAYLLRAGKLRQLTRDHTVVAELMARGALSPEEAVHHPYKSVLSRNIGGKPKSGTDVSTVELQAGDRILLCSDGLTGFAAIDAIEQVVSGAEQPSSACTDLVELALRGGGGDNVTVLVLEIGTAILPEATQILRTSGAQGWWERREEFIAAAAVLGIAKSPICAHLPEAEALELIAGNLHEAVYHDLEQTTGIHLWTFAENLASGWLGAEGPFSTLRTLLDSLRGAAIQVLLDSTVPTSPSHLVLLESAVQRALVVSEMAVTGVVAEKIRHLEAELAKQRRPVPTTRSGSTEQRTIPFFAHAEDVEAPPPKVVDCLGTAYRGAQGELVKAGDSANGSGENERAQECLEVAAESAAEYAGERDLLPAARDLIGRRELSEAGFAPLVRALERARFSHLDALARAVAEPNVAAAAIRRIARAHHALAMGVAFATIDTTLPIDEDVRASSEATAALRAEVARGERRITQLERKQEVAEQKTLVDDKTLGGDE